MKVKELIKDLSKYDGNAEIVLNTDDGGKFSIGAIYDDNGDYDAGARNAVQPSLKLFIDIDEECRNA